MKNTGVSFSPRKGKRSGNGWFTATICWNNFLQMIGVDEENIYRDVEGIEHHLSWNAIDRIGDLVQYFEENPERLNELKQFQMRLE